MSPSDSATPDTAESPSAADTPLDEVSAPSEADTPVPNTRAEWQKVLLTANDPIVTVANQRLVVASMWYDWAALGTGDRTRVADTVTQLPRWTAPDDRGRSEPLLRSRLS